MLKEHANGWKYSWTDVWEDVFETIFKSTVLPFQPDSGESKEASECSKERVELFCVGSCEELTNSICLKWRQLKSHVERLDSEGIFHQLSPIILYVVYIAKRM